MKKPAENYGTRRVGDFRVFPGQRRGTFMRDWRRCGYRNNHRWATAFHARMEEWRWA